MNARLPVTTDCVAAAEEVGTDLGASIAALRAEAARSADTWPADVQAVWHQEQDRIDEAVSEIVALLAVLDEARPGVRHLLPHVLPTSEERARAVPAP